MVLLEQFEKELNTLFATQTWGGEGCFGKQLQSWSKTFLRLDHAVAVVEGVIDYNPQ